MTYRKDDNVKQLVAIVFTAEITAGELSLSTECLELHSFIPGSFSQNIADRLRKFKDLVAGNSSFIRG